ncbi:hypothetical protein TGME49_309600 [Toxoplasma gondii ME49]|uniref:Uncharacterized protein n=3 Tax=Toxoplasma gondii TaxID=5811 RepID=B6KA39_TOXGV|nr:hypothetical protein TGME49_309600 [Toxoplasma gondii ME49]EPT26269.1 hypothetical protein TGME49_309600 [Toxoplasma gondii ME49]ESS34797.1 hypothetical protein TGVEG_309600 [Toxoplasma gondii VEG]KYF47458.1 hypothetical protein TGARI_309600 [Toxoplasma gondii ARI]CEL77272.1 TPA: hypothetical protein BN1205_093740 [Toxoplasma gondii VEG]|eukprot:XP_002364217.1 hypothetical protein TGME49_309600 [Toxoplasma gondii ME49]
MSSSLGSADTMENRGRSVPREAAVRRHMPNKKHKTETGGVPRFRRIPSSFSRFVSFSFSVSPCQASSPPQALLAVSVPPPPEYAAPQATADVRPRNCQLFLPACRRLFLWPILLSCLVCLEFHSVFDLPRTSSAGDASVSLTTRASPFSRVYSIPVFLFTAGERDDGTQSKEDEAEGGTQRGAQYSLENGSIVSTAERLERRRRASGLLWNQEADTARDAERTGATQNATDASGPFLGAEYTLSFLEETSEDGQKTPASAEETSRESLKFGPLQYNGASRGSLQKVNIVDEVAGPTNLGRLLYHVSRLNSDLAEDVLGNQVLTNQIIGSTVLALKAKSQQLGGLEKAVSVLKSNVRVGQLRVVEFRDLVRAKALERQALFRDRLGNIRDRINDAAGSIILQTMAALRGAVDHLKNEADALLWGEKYRSRLKQVELQLLGNAMKLDELRGILDQARSRVDVWVEGAGNVVQQMGQDASRLAHAGQESFLTTAAAIIKKKEEEFALFLSTPRVEVTYGDMLVDQILMDFRSSSVSIMDLSSWLTQENGFGKKTASVDEVAARLLNKLRAAEPNVDIRAVFCFVPPYPAAKNLDDGRFHIVPDLRIMQTVLAHLQKVDVARSYVVLSVDQLLIQSQIVAFDRSGKRAASAVFVLKPRSTHGGDVMFSRIDSYGFEFRRNLSRHSRDVMREALRATGPKTRVLIVYAGQRPATRRGSEASMRHHSMTYLAEAGSCAAEFARYNDQSLPEIQQLSTRLRSELRFFMAIERNCRKALVSARIPPDVEQTLHLPPINMGVYRIYHINQTAVFAAFSEVPLPSVPLSSFFRSAVGLLRLEITRSRFGRKEFAVPPRAALAQALSTLFSQRIDGDALVTLRARVTSDTRLSWVRRKKARTSIHLETSVAPPLYVGTHLVADIRKEYLTPQAILTSVADYVANKYLSQNFMRYREKLEGRVLYIQISQQG